MLNRKHWLQEYPSLNKNCHYHFRDIKKIWEFIRSGKKSDPVTVGIILVATATAVEVVGAIKEGQTASAIQKYNARVAESQMAAVKTSAEYQTQAIKTSAEFESEILQKQSEVEQAKIARAKGQTLSEQRAKYAKAGVRLEEGSPLEVMADTAAQFELDLSANRYNLATGLRKIGYESETKRGLLGYESAVKQSQLRAEAEYRRQLAKAHKTASYLKAGTTLLTGGSKIAGMSK